MRKRSRRYTKDLEKRPNLALTVEEAVKTLKGYTKAKFDQSVDIVCHLGIDPKQADQMIRGSIALPKGIGKTKKVVAFCSDGEIDACKAAGAIEAGSDELVDRITKGWMDFDVAVAHPSLMGKIAKLGRVLGPQGKMPSPKSGTVSQDIVNAVREYSAGKVEFRNDAGGNVHAIVGKLSFAETDLAENIHAFVDHIRRVKPSAAKGHYIKRVCVSGSMTPSVDLKIAAATDEEDAA